MVLCLLAHTMTSNEVVTTVHVYPRRAQLCHTMYCSTIQLYWGMSVKNVSEITDVVTSVEIGSYWSTSGITMTLWYTSCWNCLFCSPLFWSSISSGLHCPAWDSWENSFLGSSSWRSPLARIPNCQQEDFHGIPILWVHAVSPRWKDWTNRLWPNAD